MKNRTKKILKWTPSIVVSLMIVTGACLTLAGDAQLEAASSKMGMLQYMKILALAEMVFVALFLFPRTLKIGCLFLTAYFGGAIAAEISHGNIFIAPAVILALVWVGAYLREPFLFKSGPRASTSFPVV